MTRWALEGVLTASLVLNACGGPGADAGASTAETAGGEPQGEHGMTMDRRADVFDGDPLGMICPLTDETRLTLLETEGGAALVFTTASPDEVALLRRQVEQMAAMPAWSGAGDGAATLIPPASASAADVPGGARLDLRARDPNDAGALRESVAARAEELTSEECPLLGGEPTAMR